MEYEKSCVRHKCANFRCSCQPIHIVQCDESVGSLVYIKGKKELTCLIKILFVFGLNQCE